MVIKHAIIFEVIVCFFFFMVMKYEPFRFVAHSHLLILARDVSANCEA